MFTKVNIKEPQQRITKRRQYGQDVARIFSINLTNTIDGVADRCQPSTDSGSPSCPPNTVVSEADAATCVPCGENLVAENGRCVTDCHITLLEGKKPSDLSPLKGFHTVQTQHFFPSGGEEYFHVFNISFCERRTATCANSKTGSKISAGGLICRSTHLVGDQTNMITAVHTFVAGTKLVGTTANDKEGMKSKFAGIPPEFDGSLAPAFYSRYKTEVPTNKCPTGKSTTILLRCEIFRSILSIFSSVSLFYYDLFLYYLFLLFFIISLFYCLPLLFLFSFFSGYFILG